MARISTYSQDPNLEGADRVIGSDASQANATMNFSLNSLGDFYTKSGLADATRLGYRFRVNTQDPIGGIALNSNDPALVTSIDIGIEDVSGLSTSVLNSLLLDGVARIKLVSARQGEEPAQAFYTVGDISQTLDGTTLIGWNIPVTIITDAHSGMFDFSTGSDVDDTLILIPLPANAGTGGTTPTDTNAFTTIVTEDEDGTVNARLEASVSDTLTLESGPGITVVGNATPDEITFSHAIPATVATDQALTDQNFIQQLTFDQFGHVTGAVMGTATGTSQITQLPFPTLSGNFEEEGFSGTAHTHTFTLSGTNGFTIDPALANNVATIAQNAITTVTVNATWTATQDNLSSHVDDSGATRTFTTFRPVYVHTETTIPTSYTSFRVGDRVGRRITSGSTISIEANASGTTEAVIALSDTDFSSPTFRTGGFLVIEPEETITGIQSPSGTYTAYVISLTPGTTLELEII